MKKGIVLLLGLFVLSGCSSEEIKDTGKITVTTGENIVADTKDSLTHEQSIEKEKQKEEREKQIAQEKWEAQYSEEETVPESSYVEPEPVVERTAWVDANGVVHDASVADGYKCVDGTPAVGDSDWFQNNKCRLHGGWEINHQ